MSLLGAAYQRAWVIFALLTLANGILLAQEVTPESEKEQRQQQLIENYSEQTEAELDYDDIVVNLEYYEKNPINLNRCTHDDLAALNLLSEIQINNLLQHIEKNGKLLTVHELQSVEGFNEDIINMLLPFVTVSGDINSMKLNFRDVFKYGKHDIFIRYQRVLEKQKGYEIVADSVFYDNPNSYYLGSPDKIYSKYRFNYNNNVKFGLTMEKDAGEEFFKGTNKYGFDFYSGYINVNNLGVLKSIIIGDFNIQFGQGITLWTGLGFGKSSEIINIKKIARGISPFTSVYENAFMRGAGFTLGYKNFELTGFYSYKRLDANITTNDSTNNTLIIISSLQEDGQHNTIGKVTDRHAIPEQVFGGHLAFKNRRLNIGLTAYGTFLGASLIKDVQPYNVFQFNGDQNYNIGLDYSFVIRNFNFFGETAVSRSGGWSSINGLMFNIDRHVSCVVSYRYFQRNYFSFYTSPFSEGNNAYNENAFYTGLYFWFNKKIQLGAYADFYSFPWLRYRVNSPSHGQDYYAILNYKPTRKIAVTFRYKYETKFINTDEEDIAIDYLVPVNRQSYRFNISYPVSPSITFANRVEIMRYKEGSHKPESGYLLYQDIRYRNPHFPLAGSFRFTLFDTESYNARIYTYENDVLHAYSVPSFYTQGIKYYVMLQYRIGRHISIWLRFAQTYYNFKGSISSGLNEIDGNVQSEIKAQIRLSF